LAEQTEPGVGEVEIDASAVFTGWHWLLSFGWCWKLQLLCHHRGQSNQREQPKQNPGKDGVERHF